MHTDTNIAELLALHLLSENRIGGRTWREIAEEDYKNQVHFATLCRIANSGGEWLPKDRKILKALGLIEPKKRNQVQKAISKMARETNDAVVRRKPCQN